MSIQRVDSRRFPVPEKGRRFPLAFSASGSGVAAEQIKLAVLFVVAVVAVYFAPPGVSKLIFPLVIIAFWFSRKDFLWIAFFFVLAENPASFFSDLSRASLHRIPTYGLVRGISFSAFDLFVLVALVKAFFKGNRRKLELETPYILIIVYLLFSLVLSILKGADIGTIANMIRGPFFYALLVPVFFLIKNKKEAYSFILLIAPFSIFILFSQLYLLSRKTELINLLVPGSRGTVFIEGSQEIRALAIGVLIVFFSFVFSLFLLVKRERDINRRSLFLVVAGGLVSIVLSATRIWFIVFSVILCGYVFISKKTLSSVLRIVVVLSFSVIILIGSGFISKEFLLEGPLKRLGGTAAVFSGDFDSVPTLKGRYDVRLPTVLEGIRGQVLFGAGFTERYYQYYDYHVGFFNTILQFGVLGLLVFMYFFASYFLVIKRTVSRLSRSNPFRTSLKVLPLAFAGMLLANFTIWYFFPMDSSVSQPYFVAVFLGLSEVFIREAKKDEEKA